MMSRCPPKTCRVPILLALTALAAFVASAAPAPAGPYDETANASTDVKNALDAAAATGRLLLINFGANWCPDCRALAAAMREPETDALVTEHFVVVKVDVGNWDKHPDVVAEWDNPIAGGIPAVVVATPDGDVLFTTKAGQLSTARHMGPEAFQAFFSRLAALSPDA